MLLKFVAIFAALAVTPAAAQQRTPIIEGTARVVSGDTLDVGPHRIRLWGIEAPPASGAGSSPAGKAAANLLSAALAGQKILCVDTGKRSTTGGRVRIVATCLYQDRRRKGWKDVACLIVNRGHARDRTVESGGWYLACK